jgi:hypothetical protein
MYAHVAGLPVPVSFFVRCRAFVVGCCAPDVVCRRGVGHGIRLCSNPQAMPVVVDSFGTASVVFDVLVVLVLKCCLRTGSCLGVAAEDTNKKNWSFDVLVADDDGLPFLIPVVVRR